MQEFDLQEEIKACPWMMEKILNRKAYAQNLYAAWCNMQWCKRETWPVLAERYWSASWRGAGGIIASLRNEGDYMDWYCSGMGGVADYDTDPDEWRKETGFVPEGTVTEEIANDLDSLGWFPVPYDDDFV